MTPADFTASLAQATPPSGLTATLQALWWDAKGDWSRAHSLVDDLSTHEGMTVHAYLHRKEGDATNAAYWYRQATEAVQHGPLEDEWDALVQHLLRHG